MKADLFAHRRTAKGRHVIKGSKRTTSPISHD